MKSERNLQQYFYVKFLKDTYMQDIYIMTFISSFHSITQCMALKKKMGKGIWGSHMRKCIQCLDEEIVPYFWIFSQFFLIFYFYCLFYIWTEGSIHSVWKRPVVYRCGVDGRHVVHSSKYSSLEDLAFQSRKKLLWARIFKRLWSPGIDSKEWIPPAYVAWRAR